MIANLPPSPLHVSELGKFEESDLTPEMMTAKDEHVSVSPRSWELTQGWWPSIGGLGMAPRPRPRRAVLLGKPVRRPCAPQGLAVQPPGPQPPASSRSHITHGQRRTQGESITPSGDPQTSEHPPPLPTFKSTSMCS